MGDMLEEQRRSMASNERWQRSWRRVSVPGEVPADMDRGGTHKHHGSVGVRFPYPIWSETGRKGAVDGGAARVSTGGDGGTTFCWLGCRRVAGK
jgi:hypothetical protein